MFHPNEKQLNVLLDFSGKNNPKEFSVNKFIREIRPTNRDLHYQALNQELMRKRGTSVEGIALHCYQHQEAIFEAAYAALKTPTLFAPTLTMNEVYDYCVDLFVDRTWVGFEKEYEAERKLAPLLRPSTSFFTDTEFDSNYAVDLCIMDTASSAVVAAIQVKPSSYKYLPTTHHNVVNDKRKNQQFQREFGIEVDYVYWDSKTGEWENWKAFQALLRARHQEFDRKRMTIPSFN